MEILAVEWLVTFVQDFLCEVLGDVRNNFLGKLKYNKFQKELAEGIHEFCVKNECVYLNSSAFQYFFVDYHFVEEIVSRATATKISKTNKEFLRDNIKYARNIAEREDIIFGHDEERLIKDLYKLINDKVTVFFSSKLSAEQRVAISKILNSIADLREEVNAFRKDADNRLTSIDESLRDISKLSESKEKIIAELIFKSVWENDFDTLYKLEKLLDGKSSSVDKFLRAIESIVKKDNVELSISQLIEIENAFVRNVAIKTLLPFYVFLKSDVVLLESYVNSTILYEIVHAVISKEYSCIFEEIIDNDQGIDIHSFSLNKKMLCEEEWLTKQIVLLYLYELQVRNASSAMKDIIGENANWINKLLIADKHIDDVSNENPIYIDKNAIRSMVADIKKNSEKTEQFGKSLLVLYFSVLLKADFILGEDKKIENDIPESIKDCNPINAFLFMKKIERHECDVEEVYHFSEKTGAYWLLNNYFISIQNPTVLIDFCKKNESIFEKNPLIFFMFVGALKSIGAEKERKIYLKKYRTIFLNHYEFWNEYLEIDASDDVKREFVEICRLGNIGFVFSESESLLVERLLQLQEYSIASQYIHRMEIQGVCIYKIKKYKAIIEQSKGNQVDALNLFKEAYDESRKDPYVVDSIITISLVNNRSIDEKYIIAAEKIGTPRLLMLAAAAVKNNGDDIRARIDNKKALLLSDDNFIGAYSQYLTLDISDKNEYTQKISGFDENTSAECVAEDGSCLFVCIESDLVLPKSPYKWHESMYMYKDDAAEMGVLRKHIGDVIAIGEKQYRIKDIIPLDAYYFRLCIGKMEMAGEAQTICIPACKETADISALTNWFLENTKDEKTIFDWLKQYNNMEDIPLSLFTYKRFTRFSYLQFVDVIFEEKCIFVREYKDNTKHRLKDKKFVLSFSAALMLYKLGFPVDKMNEKNVYITSSTLMQVNSDCSKIIEEYDRDNVTSMGVYEGQIFVNETDETGKKYWINEAGKIKKYFNALSYVENSSDLFGKFYSEVDLKELLGICDYDAIAICQKDSSFVLITLEAMHPLLAQNETDGFEYINLIDWLTEIKISCIDLLGYVKNMLRLGCLYSLNYHTLQHISETIENSAEELKNSIYTMVDEIMKSLDGYEEKIKLLSIQSIAEDVNMLQNEGVVLDNDLLHILTLNILLLKRQKLEIVFDDSGHLVSYLRDMTEEERQSALVILNGERK